MNNLGSVIASMSIPFHDISHELVAFDSHDCLSKEVLGLTALLCIRYSTGYAAFVKDVLVDRTASIHGPIKKNDFHIFKQVVPIEANRERGGRSRKYKVIATSPASCSS